jgi:maltose O-acetyltransferase
MVAGELYNASDPELVAAYRNARRLCRAFNATRPEELEERGRMARKLFAEGGQTVRIEPPFFYDYGFNIRLGESVYFNYDCIVLDVCEVRIGSFTMFGPAVQIYTALHPMNAALRRSVEYGKPVQIGSDVWVGGGAIICPDLREPQGSNPLGPPGPELPAASSPTLTFDMRGLNRRPPLVQI